ncbi:Transcription initiation factor TFIID subunit 10 [Actinomortierella wolfii]|nr:Transcription initiation factor TFIID subunit 10 [Actinomortierella wolfii]
MSDSSGSSNDTVEDTNMDSPSAPISQTSNDSTPATSVPAAPMSEHGQSVSGSTTATPMSTPGTPAGGAVAAPVVSSSHNSSGIPSQQGSPAHLQPTAATTVTPVPSATAASPLRPGSVTLASGTTPAVSGATPAAPGPATSVTPGVASAGSAPVDAAASSPASGPGSPMTGIVQAGAANSPMVQSPAPAPTQPAAGPSVTQPSTVQTPATATPTVPSPSPALQSSQPSQQQPTPQLSDLQKAQQLQQLAAAQAAAQERAAAAAAAAASASASIAEHNLAIGAALQSRKEEELNRKDRTLAEFLPMMETYAPIIPDAVTDYYLSRTGFECEDVRIKRLLALAAQKFISDIATDAFQYCKVRQQSQKRAPGKDKKTVLTMEDLSDALGEYGINVKKADYYL